MTKLYFGWSRPHSPVQVSKSYRTSQLVSRLLSNVKCRRKLEDPAGVQADDAYKRVDRFA